jgi:hypothetical protein
MSHTKISGMVLLVMVLAAATYADDKKGTAPKSPIRKGKPTSAASNKRNGPSRKSGEKNAPAAGDNNKQGESSRSDSADALDRILDEDLGKGKLIDVDQFIEKNRGPRESFDPPAPEPTVRFDPPIEGLFEAVERLLKAEGSRNALQIKKARQQAQDAIRKFTSDYKNGSCRVSVLRVEEYAVVARGGYSTPFGTDGKINICVVTTYPKSVNDLVIRAGIPSVIKQSHAELVKGGEDLQLDFAVVDVVIPAITISPPTNFAEALVEGIGRSMGASVDVFLIVKPTALHKPTKKLPSSPDLRVLDILPGTKDAQ